MRSSHVAMLLLLLAGCSSGTGIDNLAIPPAPLFHLTGHVDLRAAIAASGGKPLRAALVWGGVPRYNTTCLKNLLNAELQAACPDPFGFVPGEIATTIPLDLAGDGSFVLSPEHLPSADVSVGTDLARIAWGSVLVAADTNDNGLFDLIAQPADPKLPRGPADLVVAASFFSLHAPQQRIAFREGGFQEPSYFYPSLGCEAPPPGFSLLTTPGLVGLDAAPGDCTNDPLAAGIEAGAIPAVESKGLACRTMGGRRSGVRQPDDKAPGTPRDGGGGGGGDRPPDTGKMVCLDAETLAFITDAPCPDITTYALSGCEEDPACTAPEWDLRKAIPSWWPCKP